jgi:hypothetical protein
MDLLSSITFQAWKRRMNKIYGRRFDAVCATCEPSAELAAEGTIESAVERRVQSPILALC